MQKNVNVTFGIVGKRTEGLSSTHAYTYLCLYVCTYTDIHVCRCIGMSGMIPKDIAMVVASEAVVDDRIPFACATSLVCLNFLLCAHVTFKV